MSDVGSTAEQLPSMEQVLRHMDQVVEQAANGKWDLPPALFVVTANGSLGLVSVTQEEVEERPDPTVLFDYLADQQRAEIAMLRARGLKYREVHPQRVAAGEPVAVIGIVESYGMNDEEYARALRNLPPGKHRALVERHGYVPLSDLPEAREQRNFFGVDKDLNSYTLSRYRDTMELEYIAEGKNQYLVVGRLNNALISFLGAIRAAWEFETEVPSDGEAGS